MESPPPDAAFFINNEFNPVWFEAWSQVLTLQECDARYLKRSGGVVTGSLQILQSLIVTNNVTASLLTGTLQTGAQPNITSVGTLGSLNVTNTVTCTNLAASTINGATILTQATADARYLQLSGGTLTGNLLLGSNRVGINTSSPACAIDLGSTASSNKLAIFNNSTVFYGLGAISSQLRYLSDSAHAWYTSSTPSSAGTQLMTLSSAGVLSMQAATIYSSQASGSNSGAILSWGNDSDSYCRWQITNFLASSNINSHFSITNVGVAGAYGINIGSFAGLNSSDGTMVVLNGSQGDGNFITCGSSSTNGALHINAGIPQAVPSGWGYTSSGSASIAGGTVSVSMYAYNHLWVRGSLFCTSDGRLKNVIAEIDSNKALALLKVKPVWYRWKGDDERSQPQLGLLAQDVCDAGLDELCHLFDNDSMEEDAGRNIPKGKQLVLSYDRLPLYLLEIIKIQQAKIEKLEGDYAVLSTRAKR